MTTSAFARPIIRLVGFSAREMGTRQKSPALAAAFAAVVDLIKLIIGTPLILRWGHFFSLSFLGTTVCFINLYTKLYMYNIIHTNINTNAVDPSPQHWWCGCRGTRGCRLLCIVFVLFPFQFIFYALFVFRWAQRQCSLEIYTLLLKKKKNVFFAFTERAINQP